VEAVMLQKLEVDPNRLVAAPMLQKQEVTRSHYLVSLMLQMLVVGLNR